jgi:hypothetical protein
MKTFPVDYNNVSNLVGNTTTLGGSAGLCLLTGAETALVGCAPLIGEAIYTANNIGDNYRKGRPMLDGWSWQDATIAAVGTYVMAATGFFSDVVSQEAKHPLTLPNLAHASCQGVAGAGSALAVFSKTWTGVAKSAAWSLLTGFDSNEVCNEVFGG